MKKLVVIIGIILIIIGIAGYTSRYFTYTTKENVAQLGPLHVTEEKQNVVIIPPMFSGLALVVGGLLVIVAFSRKP